MPFLLDTVTLAEFRKKSKAAPSVVAWQNAVGGGQAFVSVVTLNEIRYGKLKVEGRDPAFAKRLDTWYREILGEPLLFAILPIDLAVAERGAAFRASIGTSIFDAFIAATAQVHGLTLATRNTADFQATGIQLVNPWEHPV